ncbi:MULTISPECIES: nitric oxide reductase activation protein NorD [unclassified Colwellia]|jgi:nitric oxide reductase NorD protein|uniref:nitric oxide reductase activation protein NorD n=1 Tax=unclassified Colwellia TaxID=196834 RepID=UPI0015F520DA|nr:MULTISPECIES: VWA domain-containing protein [unclassified Colwellia]MBA6379088.1 VWA domain-containing protein [Colwellia sp. BRX10-7]MBA6387190.1 VWA domain-containing protein [Colwellia sp. BRX10-2]MBA6400063.1 VWA domain-containing protein [Colwellia sp. BRX10-5]MBA6403942.1 VWA domain-containing protein [Colwellia sp. BRX10-1]
MEEWVGGIWHKYITRKASTEYEQASVCFSEVSKSVGMVFRALGGDVVKRIEAASSRDYLVRRTFLQKVSGENQQISLAWQDPESLRLPERLAVFPTTELNRDLYIWLAILAAHHSGRFQHWAIDNQQLVVEVLTKFPALTPRYQRLAQAFLVSRPSLKKLPEQEKIMEQAIVQAILEPGTVKIFPTVNYAPKAVFLWLYPSAHVDPLLLPDYQDITEDENQAQESKQSTKNKISRKKADREQADESNDGMMIFRLESLFSWSEFSKLDRGSDDTDEDEEDLLRTAEDLDNITLSQQQDQKSANIKIDLDLPSASEDDIPLGKGISLPEWNYRTQQLEADRCLLQPMLPKNYTAQSLPIKLQKTAKAIQAQFEQLTSVRYWLKAQPQGEELDLSAWLDFYVESKIAPTQEKGLYQSFRGNNRDISSLLLADLSMSTDAYLDDDNRVIDVVRDSMLLFGEALNSVGDNFAMYGFSSVRRSNVRLTMLKNFNEPYNDEIRGRVQSIRPGFYTRMGAAIRQATKVLQEQRSTQKLLLILTDGKPNDIDHYEGRFGIEDTHQAIAEANRLGIKPFCITIDQEAEEYLPYLFGRDGFTVILRPAQLPIRLPQLYHQLTSH